jgi:hypothetical protein
MKLLEAPAHKVRQMNRDVLQKKLKEQNGDGRAKRTATLAQGTPPRNSLPCLGRKERTD